MKYRRLGRTNLSVSEIGIGCEGLIEKDQAFIDNIIDKAINNGINCIDLYSPNPKLRSHLGVALSGRRDKFILQGHLCTIWQDDQYKATRSLIEVKESFADLLERLSTDYIDIGMIHYIDSIELWNEILNGGIMDYALELKKEGKIKFIGVSSHNAVVSAEMVKSGYIDLLMFALNPSYDVLPPDVDVYSLIDKATYEGNFINIDPDRKRLYEICQRTNTAITVMKAFSAGLLLNEDSPSGITLSVNQCIQYALDRPAVASVIVGVHSLDELDECIAFETIAEGDPKKDYSSVLANAKNINWQGHCMYCGHCAPCSSSINVAYLTKLLDIALSHSKNDSKNEIPETVREHYKDLEHHASDCIECGDCESRCPFGVKVIENMKKAKKIFE